MCGYNIRDKHVKVSYCYNYVGRSCSDLCKITWSASFTQRKIFSDTYLSGFKPLMFRVEVQCANHSAIFLIQCIASQEHEASQVIHTVGCITSIIQFLESNLYYAAGIIFGITLFQVLCNVIDVLERVVLLGFMKVVQQESKGRLSYIMKFMSTSGRCTWHTRPAPSWTRSPYSEPDGTDDTAQSQAKELMLARPSTLSCCSCTLVCSVCPSIPCLYLFWTSPYVGCHILCAGRP